MESKNVYEYIIGEENAFATTRVPLTNSKDWNFKEHVERCTNVSNGWFHAGKNDGLRPYNDIVTPIINVAFRSEGFDVKDIVPYVNDSVNFYKSFLIKKYHPQWARKHEIDTFIDDVVESSIIYDLVLVKNVNNVRPEVVDLKTIAFCDQTDIMAGPICIKHQLTPAELVEFKGKWEDDKIDEAIIMAQAEKSNSIANDKKVKTPGKYIEIYELRGNLPKSWLKGGGSQYEYTPQMKVVCFYTSKDGNKNGITLYEGKDKPLNQVFKSLKIDRIRSRGRACGRSIVESLFEPQVWVNYDAIKIKQLLDSAFSILVTDSEELGNQKLSELKLNTVIKKEKGSNIERIDGSLNNIPAFSNHQIGLKNDAQTLGSASDASLGRNPVSGTPFALQNLVVQQGQGIHEYRQGKIASFFSDVLYRDWILQSLVDDMNNGKDFSEEMSLDEIMEIAETISTNQTEKKIKENILKTGIVPTNEEREMMKQTLKDDIVNGKTPMYSKGRGFMKALKGELKNIPISVFINIKSKQKDMARSADALTNVIREIMRNPQAFSQIPDLGKAFNSLLEDSGMSAMNFSGITKLIPQAPQPNAEVVPAEINSIEK